MDRGELTRAIEVFDTVAKPPRSRSKRLAEFRVAALQNRAAAYMVLGDLDRAEQSFLEARAIAKTTGKARAELDRAVRGNLAMLYAQIGDLATARTMLETLVADRALGVSDRAIVLTHLGHVLYSQREFVKAEAAFSRALVLTRNGTSLHTGILINQIEMYRRAGDTKRAAELAQRALKALRAMNAENSGIAAVIMAVLGMSALEQGRLAEAERLLESADAILSKQKDVDAKAVVRRASAVVAQRRGNHAQARRLSREALDYAETQFDRILGFGSEAQRLAYQKESAPFDQLATVGDAELLAEAVLTMKGAVLDSLLAERAIARFGTKEERARLLRINQTKLQIMNAIAQGKSFETFEDALKSEETALARTLAARLRPSRGRITSRQIQGKLDRGEVLVEIVRFRRTDAPYELSDAYGAIVIAREGDPQWIPLGKARPVEDDVYDLMRRFGGDRSMGAATPQTAADVAAQANADAEVAVVLKNLYQRVWLPLERSFPRGTKKVIVSPDGVASFLPWAVLLDDRNRFIAERWPLMQIGSGRDLLHPPPPAGVRTLLALGDSSGDLSYSRKEVDVICNAAQRHGWQTTKLLQGNAKESSLRGPAPRILHVATHAGRLSGEMTETVQTRLSRNPMYRGVLLLGGAKKTLALWNKGANVSAADDGILTAEEAGALELNATWLTVLSGCETGIGDARAGEGVMGLRRGFALAGTQHLLFSLWPIADDSTAQFMEAFYGDLFRTNEPPAAFHEAQLSELIRWRNEKGLEAAVYRAGGFLLTR
ncbi:MAG TPA: CHAT domain-containing protein [Thermoanaerobaculia bacterium]|nr:CHAT domain-containing protein [Thermoanaerobaculia bacterium]